MRYPRGPRLLLQTIVVSMAVLLVPSCAMIDSIFTGGEQTGPTNGDSTGEATGDADARAATDDDQDQELIELPLNQELAYSQGLSNRFQGESDLTDLGFTIQRLRGNAVVRSVDPALEELINVGDVVIAVNDDTVDETLAGYYAALLQIRPGDLVLVTLEQSDAVRDIQYRAGSLLLPADDAYILRNFVERRAEGIADPPVLGIVAEDARSAVIESVSGVPVEDYDGWRERAMSSAVRFAETHFGEYERNIRLADRRTFNGILADNEISAADLFATERVPGLGGALPVDFVSVVRLEEVFVGDENRAQQRLYRRLVEVESGEVVASVEFATDVYEADPPTAGESQEAERAPGVAPPPKPETRPLRPETPKSGRPPGGS